jgi:hypothetical protein
MGNTFGKKRFELTAKTTKKRINEAVRHEVAIAKPASEVA